MAIQYTARDFYVKLFTTQPQHNYNYAYDYFYKKKVSESDTDMEALQEDITKLKKSVKNLGKYSESGTTKTRLKSQLESLVKTYNSYNKKAGKISDDETKEQIEKLEELFSENEKALKKIGLKKSDKKLELDSDTFDGADQKWINKLFVGRNSFVNQASKIVRKLEDCADKAQYSVKEHNFSGTMRYSDDDINLVKFFIGTTNNANILSNLGEGMESGKYNEDIVDAVKENLKTFAEWSNNYDSEGYDSEYYDKVKALCEDYQSELSKIGIAVENTSGKKTIKYDGGIGDFDREAFINLFGKNAEFINSVKECYINGCEQTIKAKKIGVSIVDEYL